MLCLLFGYRNASMSTSIQVSESLLSLIHLEVELLDHMVILFSVFLRNCQNFSTMATPFHSRQKVPFFSYPYQHYYFLFCFLFCSVLNRHPSKHEVAPHCGSGFTFLFDDKFVIHLQSVYVFLVLVLVALFLTHF